MVHLLSRVHFWAPNQISHGSEPVNIALCPATTRSASLIHPGTMTSDDLETNRTRTGYQRSKGTERGEQRRQQLLQRVTDDLAVNGLIDFSLRRAARAADTTHKVLLYYFDGPDDLLQQAVARLRERRLTDGLAAVAEYGTGTLGSRIRATWPSLINDEVAPALNQAIGLAMTDPQRHAALGRAASSHFLPALASLCPEGWSERRKLEVAEMTLATLRGLLIEWRTTGDAAGVDAGLAALTRALDREERNEE